MVRRAAYPVALGAYLGLTLMLIAWITWLAPPPATLVTPVLLVIVGPLLLPLRGLLHQRRYTLAWSTLLILAYFVHGVVYAAGAPPGRWLGLAEVALTLVYFTAITAYLRLTRAPAPEAAPAPRE